jgi:type III pantothenate kinase
MILLIDIGNTNTHLGLGTASRVGRRCEMPTAAWFGNGAAKRIRAFVGTHSLEGIALCSVVPKATAQALRLAERQFKVPAFQLTSRTLPGLTLDYPRPETIGPDRLANAVAMLRHYGAPSVAVGFGTAAIFDVVDAQGRYVGGVIAPGIACLTSYLHEKTALLPRVEARGVKRAIGKSTREAMTIAAVSGYAGLVRELLRGIQSELGVENLPVTATGGYASLMARRVPEITAVRPDLTLEGVRLTWFDR